MDRGMRVFAMDSGTDEGMRVSCTDSEDGCGRGVYVAQG